MAASRSGSKEELLSPNAAGRIAGVTGEAVKQWIYRRKIPAVKLPNGYWKIRRKDLDELLRARKRPPKRRLLLVSSDGALLKAVSSAARDKTHEVYTASNRADALLKARDKRPSAILIDLSDPSADGLDLARGLRQTQGFKRMPLLFVASRADAQGISQEDLLGTSAQGLLLKPVKVAELAVEIEKLCPSS